MQGRFKPRQVSVLGVLYPSLAAAWRTVSPVCLSEGLVRRRISELGWTDEDALLIPVHGRTGKPIVVDNTYYCTLRDAWRSVSPTGLNYGVVANRIARGWAVHVALLACVER